MGRRPACASDGVALMLLLDDAALDVRRAVARGPLAPLARSLASDLERLIGGEIFIPPEKALLSREGGRCARDGTLLEFDPFDREHHRCRVCGTVYTGELHYRFWIYWYQLWLAERVVHATLLSTLGIDERFHALGRRILEQQAARYLSYPNVDNVLGPSRLFFSTYLESIWLLNICVATDLLPPRDAELRDDVRDRIIEPARAIIAQFDEGRSNRQVWNDAALLAAARLLDDDRAAEDAVFGISGVATHLADNLLSDGTWYEGENYHLFAHRGLWYGLTMAERAGLEMPAPLVERFQLGFAAPFATALPDFTLPSRRDSQYAISLRQWRIAEHCELGVARRADAPLLAALREMYETSDDGFVHDTGRARSSADVERNAPPTALSRADLNWRALLFARPELPGLKDAAPRSVLLDAQGIAVFRRARGDVYAALDYGHSGGGHGHPDRLNLILADRSTRWLDDFGTGSYVDPSLHWYRSTLAHNAPLFDGRSQLRVHGELGAYEETDEAGWITATADDVAPGVAAARTLVVMPTYCVDIVQWDAERDVVFDLPLHVDAQLVSPNVDVRSAPLDGGSALEDGIGFVRDTAVQSVPANVPVTARAKTGEQALDVFAQVSAASEWWRATAPAAPGNGDHRFRLIRSRANTGEVRIVWSWAGDVVTAIFGSDIRVRLADGREHRHEPTEDGWRIEETASGSSGSPRVVNLGGLTDAVTDVNEFVGRDHEYSETAGVSIGTTPLRVELGERHYRRSEQSWREAGEPRASVAIAWNANQLSIHVDMPRSDRTFVAAGTVNRYDNEPAEINGDGVQIYVRTSSGEHAWLLVPVLDTAEVRAVPIEGWQSSPAPNARWRPTAQGYELDVGVPLDRAPLGLDVIVNEMPRGRERRRGQLVLSGADGEFVYLQGDRHDAARLVPLRFADD